jgi:hypothetical protein
VAACVERRPESQKYLQGAGTDVLDPSPVDSNLSASSYDTERRVAQLPCRIQVHLARQHEQIT